MKTKTVCRLTIFLLVFCFVAATLGCNTIRSEKSTKDITEIIAEKISSLGAMENLDGTVQYDVLIQYYFSSEEIKRMHRQIDSVEDYVNDCLEKGELGAAAVAAYFRLEACLPFLREALLTDRYFYGWEGPDYSKDEAYLIDDQYPHHRMYIAAIEGITGKPLAESVKLTASEKQALLHEAALAEQISDADWSLKAQAMRARWLLLKLNVEIDEPQPGS